MAVVNLGRVAYINKGAYGSAETYEKYDVVLYNNGSYVYINDTSASGKTPTDTAYWQAMLDPTAMNEAVKITTELAEEVSRLSEEKVDKAYMVTLFEELRTAILAEDTDGAVALLDEAILDLSVLA